MECIHCTQCADACDAIMDGIGRPRGLIRYSSRDELGGQPRRILRPRVVLYPLLLAVVWGALAYALLHRAPADVTVLRGIGSPFTVTPSGMVMNQIRVKIVNRDAVDRRYQVDLVEPAGAARRSGSSPRRTRCRCTRASPRPPRSSSPRRAPPSTMAAARCGSASTTARAGARSALPAARPGGPRRSRAQRTRTIASTGTTEGPWPLRAGTGRSAIVALLVGGAAANIALHDRGQPRRRPSRSSPTTTARRWPGTGPWPRRRATRSSAGGSRRGSSRSTAGARGSWPGSPTATGAR